LILFLIAHIFILKHQVKIRTNALQQMLSAVNMEVENRTAELSEINKKLEIEIDKHIKIENELTISREKISEQSACLEQSNKTLQNVINEAAEERKKIEIAVKENINTMVLPILKKIESSNDNNSKIYSRIVQENLLNIFSAFGINLKQLNKELSPREIEICNLIKNGLTNKEIAELINLSHRSVEKHRENIRKKLQLTNQNTEIKKYLDTIL